MSSLEIYIFRAKKLIYFTSLFVLIQGYETQKYEVLEQIGNVEIRYYPPAMKVKTMGVKSSSNNFNTLFRYISGNNEAQEKIAMTTPVYRSLQGNKEVMEFVLPSKYKNTAPTALRGSATVYQSKAGYFAAIRFGGYTNALKIEIYTQKLLEVLSDAGKRSIGKPQVLSYDAPYKFYNRRNEIVVEIKK